MKKITVTASLFLLLCASLSAAASVQIFNTGYQGKYIQADTANNPVAHFKINADAQGDTLTYISVENYLDSWYVGSAEETASIMENGIKVWYYPVDTPVFSPASAQYVTHLAVTGSNWWDNTFSLPVTNGSGIWITADIDEYPAGGTCEFQFADIQFESGTALSGLGLPSQPPVMILTQAKPVEEIAVSHTGGSMQPYISTAQENINAGEFRFLNNSSSGSASAVISSITLTVKTYNPYGTVIPPSSVIRSLKIQDKNFGTIYGQVSASAMPSTAAPFSVPLSLLNIPAGLTITANILITCTEDNSSAGSNFVISIEDSASVIAYDYYSLKSVSVNAAPFDPTGFPMDSNFASIQKRAVTITASLTNLIPANINKGQLNVALAGLVLSNPGDTLTASAETYNLTFHFADSASEPLTPAHLFSRLSVTDPTGSIIYGIKEGSSIEASGGFAVFPLSAMIPIPAGGAATLTVRADINPLTTATGFKIGLASTSDILSRDRNSFAPAAVTFQGSLPSWSPLALLTSSCLLSHTPQLPPIVYKGSGSVPVISFSFSSPQSFGGGNLLASGLTLACKDADGLSLNFNSIFSSINMSISGVSHSFSALPSSSSFYAEFAVPVTITASGPVIEITGAIKPETPAKSFQVSLESAYDISRYQDNDPAREIFIAAAGGFPMASGKAYIGGAAAGLSLSAYPNPFRSGSSAVVSYYLSQPGSVSIEIYDIMGNLIKTVTNNSPRAAGSRAEDFWDGTDNRGRAVNSGTYVVRISAGSGNMTRKITFIK